MRHDPSAWFAGPKSENAEAFTQILHRVIDDYYNWRRNCFPEDGAIVHSATRRQNEAFADAFDDLLVELLARLKGCVPNHSPRYAGHMLAEQTLPSIAGLLAGLLYNPNNVSFEAAPITVNLELEAAEMLCQMVGYDPSAWGHLCSGGTVANYEALWVARSAATLPWLLQDLGVDTGQDPNLVSPSTAITHFDQCLGWMPSVELKSKLAGSPFNIANKGVAAVQQATGRRLVLAVPESHHYCFGKACDLLGLGRDAIRLVPVDSDFRMNVEALESVLDRADSAGEKVFAVVAVIGTTEEGAVDPLDKILELRRRRESSGKPSFWLHADGAYGGYLRTVTLPVRIGLGDPATETVSNGVRQTVRLEFPHACDSLEHLPECDSVTIDPHKLGYVPYPAGAICFQSSRVKHLVKVEAPYISDKSDDFDLSGLGLYILEGSKPGAVAASVWMSHKLIGLNAEGHGQLVRHSIRSACELHALLTGLEHDTVRAVPLCQPGSNIVCYAFRPQKTASLQEINRLNEGLYRQFSIQEGHRTYENRFFVSRTHLYPSQYGPETVAPFLKQLGVSEDEYQSEGVFLIRSVMMNPWYEQAKTHGRFYVSELVDALSSKAAELAV